MLQCININVIPFIHSCAIHCIFCIEYNHFIGSDDYVLLWFEFFNLSHLSATCSERPLGKLTMWFAKPLKKWPKRGVGPPSLLNKSPHFLSTLLNSVFGDKYASDRRPFELCKFVNRRVFSTGVWLRCWSPGYPPDMLGNLNAKSV